MKKTIPFNLFGENQYIMFDIIRIAELERALGRNINSLVASGDAGVDFCLKALPIGMKQHYAPNPKDYAERIEAHLEAGGKLSDIEIPLIKAILASGIYGKSAAKKAEKAIAEAEAEQAPDEDLEDEEKNAEERTEK